MNNNLSKYYVIFKIILIIFLISTVVSGWFLFKDELSLEYFLTYEWGFVNLIVFLYSISIFAASICGIAILKVFEGKYKSAIWMMNVGAFTLGIWPLLTKPAHKAKIVNDETIAKLYKIGVTLSIIGIVTLYFLVGFIILAIAATFIGTALILQNKKDSGVLIIFVGALTLGIWPLIVANIEMDELKMKQSEVDHE